MQKSLQPIQAHVEIITILSTIIITICTRKITNVTMIYKLAKLILIIIMAKTTVESGIVGPSQFPIY